MQGVPEGKRRMDWLLPWGTLLLMCGIWLGRRLDSMLPAALGLALCLAAVGICPRLRLGTLAVTAVVVGAMMGQAAYHPAMPDEGDYSVCGTISREVSLGDKGQVQTVLSSVTLDGKDWPDAYWTYYPPDGEMPDWLTPGARVQMTARVYHPSGNENPGGFNFAEYLFQRGVRFGIYGAADLHPAEAVFSLRGGAARIRHDLTEALMAVMGEESGAYAAAMLLGNQDFIPEDERQALRDLGIAHVLSVSGFHTGVLVMLLSLLMKPLPIPRTGKMLLTGMLLLGYCLLTGESAPVVRAAGLLLLREYVRIRNRQALPLHLLCASAIGQLALNPTLLTGPSFQLSYGAMLGIIAIAPALKRLRTFESSVFRRLWEGVCVSLAAQIGVLAPQLYWFGELPLLGLLVNPLAAGLFGELILLYWATLVCLPVPGLAEGMGALAAGATEDMLRLVRWMAGGAVTLWTRQADLLTLAGWVMLIVFSIRFLPEKWAAFRRKMLVLAAVLTALILLPVPEWGSDYLQLSVGNEDAAVLQDRDLTVVIDTGEDGAALASYLHQRRQTVEVLIITHLHMDHAGGVAALLSQGIPVETCYLPSGAALPQIDEEALPLLAELAQTGTVFVPLSRGDEIKLPSGRLKVLWPLENRAGPLHDANDVSLVLHAEVAGVSLLLTGDQSGTYEQYAVLPADVLKVAHHGSKNATSPSFLTAAAPQMLLLSNKDEARTWRMEDLAGEVPLYVTDGGAIRITFLGAGEFSVEKFGDRGWNTENE